MWLQDSSHDNFANRQAIVFITPNSVSQLESMFNFNSNSVYLNRPQASGSPNANLISIR